MDIRQKAVEPSSWLHLKDSADELMFEPKRDAAGAPLLDGEGQSVNDPDRPVRVHLHSPGSKAYARAQAAKNNRMMEKLRKKGKVNDSAEQQTEEAAEFLAACTIGWENMEYSGITEPSAMAKAIYGDVSIGFIAEQVGKHLGEWGNFSPTAPKP